MRKEIKYNDVPFVPCNDCSNYEDCREDAYQQGREDAIEELKDGLDEFWKGLSHKDVVTLDEVADAISIVSEQLKEQKNEQTMK